MVCCDREDIETILIPLFFFLSDGSKQYNQTLEKFLGFLIYHCHEKGPFPPFHSHITQLPNIMECVRSDQSLSHVRLFSTP